MNHLFKIPENNSDTFFKEEQVVWQGKSSQLVNLKNFMVYGIIGGALVYGGLRFSVYLMSGTIICAAKMLYNWYYTNTAIYILTNQRIIRRSGVLNKTTFEIELYRVKDALLFEPLLLRFFSLGNIQLSSSQKSTHHFMIEAVAQSTSLRETIRKLVERRRSEKGVGEFDTTSYAGWQ
jgi:uncharacterized membrane protein YdbT with pleckstrin-like domain